MDEQWQYVGAHAGRLPAPEKGRGDFWLWACIDADTSWCCLTALESVISGLETVL
jgi:hypothetical protein